MMKRRPVLAVFALLAALPMISAQPRGPGGGGNRLDYLAGYLSLTDTQKTQAKVIFDAAEAANETSRGQLKSATESLTAAVKAGKGDGELDSLGAAVGVVQGQMAATGAKASAKFYALLTAEQKAKYDARGERGGMGGGGGPRRR
jgi:Spy/CpxP family protein refolding chaperone